MIKKSTLKEAKPEDIIRLAKWMGLHINDYSINQVIDLIIWRLHKNRKWQN